MNSENSILNLLQKSKDFLDKKKVSGNTRLDAEILLAQVLKLDRIKIYMQYNRLLNDDEMNSYRNYIVRRSKHEPVAYITGSKEFFNLNFIVNKSVLIPRPETEELVSWVLEFFSNKNFDDLDDLTDEASNFNEHFSIENANETEQIENTQTEDTEKNNVNITIPDDNNKNESTKLQVLDLACGSGCIGISLKKYMPKWEVFFSDISKEAIHICKSNYENNFKKVLANEKSLVSNYFNNFPDNLKNSFDVIICNPPYINDELKESIMPDVLNWEPHLALFNANPLNLYLHILKEAGAFLKEGASIFMEGDPDFLPKLASESSNLNYKFIELRKDLSKKERMIHFIKTI